MATERRLISLDEAIAKVKDDGILGEGYSDDERIDDVCDILESCESVDAVEVIRCKDCKHWSMGYCNHFAYYSYEPMTNEDGFCSYGERKDNV